MYLFLKPETLNSDMDYDEDWPMKSINYILLRPRFWWNFYTCGLCLVTQLCLTLCVPVDCSPPGSSVHGDSPGKNTGVGCHALLQGIFPTQWSNPGLPHCRWILYCLSYRGSPNIFFFLVLLKYTWYKHWYEFKTYKIMIWFIYGMKWWLPVGLVNIHHPIC